MGPDVSTLVLGSNAHPSDTTWLKMEQGWKRNVTDKFAGNFTVQTHFQAGYPYIGMSTQLFHTVFKTLHA